MFELFEIVINTVVGHQKEKNTRKCLLVFFSSLNESRPIFTGHTITLGRETAYVFLILISYYSVTIDLKSLLELVGWLAKRRIPNR